MTTLNYGIIDCDTHCYETRDAFTRYLPEEFKDRAITTVRGADGVEAILAGRRVATFNLLRMLATWLSTVRVPMKRCEAISGSVKRRQTRRSTSRSRRVRWRMRGLPAIAVPSPCGGNGALVVEIGP